MRLLEKGREKGFLRSMLSLLLDRRSVPSNGTWWSLAEVCNCKYDLYGRNEYPDPPLSILKRTDFICPAELNANNSQTDQRYRQ